MAKILLYVRGREDPALLQAGLMRHGHEVYVSTGGGNVFDELQEFKPDVVALVCDMPLADDVELSICLRNQGGDIPVIFVPEESAEPGTDPECRFDPKIIEYLDSLDSL